MTPAEKIKQLSEQRLTKVTAARAIHTKATSEKRDMTADEKRQFDANFAEVDTLKEQIDVAVSDEKRAKQLEDEQRWAGESSGRKTAPTEPNAGGAKGDEVREITWNGNGRYFSERSIPLFDGKGNVLPNSTADYRAGFNRFMRTGEINGKVAEVRNLQSDGDVQGGFTVLPQQIVAGILKFVDNAVFIRQKATVTQVPTAASLGIVSLDTDIDDSDWTAELLEGNEDASMAFGKRELLPHPLAKRIKISNKLLRQSPNVESLVRDRLAYKIAIPQEKGFMTGTGAQQPLGLFTASTNGITTGRDVSTGNTATGITADGLINAKYSLKAQYQRTAEWVFHRDGVKMIRKLKDGNGQYLWSAGLGGTPDTLLDRPVNQSEYAPNTFTTGLYAGLIGDLSFYYIADALMMGIQRLVELYAATNQTGFIVRAEVDGMPALEEAFARVALA